MRYIILALTALMLVSCSSDPNYLKQKYLDSGNKYYEKKNLKAANIMYRKALEKDRRFGPAYYKLAVVDLDMGDISNAFQMLRRAVDLLPSGTKDSDDATLKLAEIELLTAQSAKDPARLIKDVKPMVDGLLKRNPSSWEGHKLSGDMLLLQAGQAYKAGDTNTAKSHVSQTIQEYRTALTAKPGDYVITLAL